MHGVGDPSRDRHLRDHLGIHPQNLDHMSKAREWEGLFKEAHRMISERLRREDTEKLLVLVFCRAGRHRSVATGHVLCHNLQADGSIVSLDHLSQGSFWRNTCGGECKFCSLEDGKAQSLYDQAMQRYRAQWTSFPPLESSTEATRSEESRKVYEERSEAAGPDQGGHRRGRDLSRDDRGRKRQAVESTDPGSRVRSKGDSFENEEARIIEVLTPFEDEETSRQICSEFLSRIYAVFKPAGVAQINNLLDKHQWNYTELVLSVARKYLSDSKGSATLMIEDIVEKTTAAARHVEVEGSFHARADEVRELKSLVLQVTETVNQLKAATSKPPEPPGPPPGHKFDAVKREEALTAGAEDVEVPADEEPAAPAEDSSQALPAVGSTERHPDIRRRDLAGYEVDAENPQALSNEFLNRIFEGQRKQKNFLLWIPNTAPDCPKVRVNAKFDAWNTYVKYPDEFTWHRKSTLVQYTDGGDWELYEDRVKAHHYKAFAYTPRRCLIFLLPPRADLETDGTGKGEHFAHVALTGPDVRDAPTNIMSKKERQDFHAGLKKESHRSNFLMKALGKFATLAGLIFMITPHEFADSSGIFESETLFIRSPGPEGKFLSNPTWCQNISEEINNLKPDLVVTIHQIPDNHTDIDNRWLVDLYRSLSDGQVGVVIDAAVTPRWKAWQSGQIEDDRFGDFVVYETRGGFSYRNLLPAFC